MTMSSLQTSPTVGTAPSTNPQQNRVPLHRASRKQILGALFKREFFSYFRSPVAYVFLAVFIIASNGLTWFVGNFFESNDASLSQFFTFLPWVYLFLIPAVGMRLWSEEKKSGTWELLFTYPLRIGDAVIAKFLAGWAFIGAGLVLTCTMPFTLAYLGNPDLGPIIAGYFGALLMAGSYLGICSLASAITRNQVVSFVLGLIGCLVLLFLGWSIFNDVLHGIGLPVSWVDFIANLGFLPHFEPMGKGLIALRDIFYFIFLTVFALWLNTVVLER